MSPQVRFYNPREASADVLEAMLVGRDEIVAEVMDDLTRQSRSASRQHWLIRGPRGIGKTHFVGILYHRIRRSPALSKKYLPIWLSETDVYEVYSVAILLLAIARQLVEELRADGDPQASHLEDQIEGLEAGGDDPALFEELCELLREEARKRKRIFLVLMENLDALFTSFAKQRSSQEIKRLRSLLTQDKEFLFLSTTPTRYLSQLSDPKAPLYGHLKERNLRPLTEDQVGELFLSLGKVTNQQERGELLAGPGSEGRLRRRVLHRLAGGNPRAIVMAFSVVAGAPGVKAVVEEMSALLDTQTAYFEARLARLAPRERTILTSLALAPTNLTLQEIAQRTRLPERTLSTQVSRLIEEGHVSPVEGEGGKGRIYELTDGLFRLWYQYRKGRKVLRPIVQFLANWHPVEELEHALSDLQAAALSDLSLIERDVHQITALQLEEALIIARSEEGRAARERLWLECEGALSEPETDLMREVLALIDKLVGPEDERPSEAAISDVIHALREALKDEEKPEYTFWLGWLLWTTGRSIDVGVSLIRKAADWKPEDPAFQQLYVLAAGLGLVVSGPLDEALDFLMSRLSYFNLELSLKQQIQVVETWKLLADRLSAAQRFQEQLDLFQKIVEPIKQSKAPELREVLLKAELKRGKAFADLERWNEALASASNIANEGWNDKPDLQSVAAEAMILRGSVLRKLGRRDEQLAAFERVIEGFSASEHAGMQHLVASSMLWKGLTLAECKRVDESLVILEALHAKFQAAAPSNHSSLNVLAAFSLGLEYRGLGHVGEAESVLIEGFETLAAHQNPVPGVLRAGLYLLLSSFDLAFAERCLQILRKGRGTAEMARLYGFVLDVLKAGKPRQGTRGPAERIRKALARVPPELRESVREISEKFRTSRRSRTVKSPARE